MQSPLPARQGTSVEIIDQAFRALQRRLNDYGGQLEDTAENTRLLAQHMKAHGVDPSTTVYKSNQILDALWLGTCELFSQLSFRPRPEKLYMKLLEAKAQQLEVRDIARRAKEAAENIAAYDIQARAEKELEKKQRQDQKVTDEKAREARNQLIGDYTVNAGPNRIDQTKTEEGRNFLKKIKITGRDGKFSETLTLEAVSEVRWFDTVEAMSKALDRWIDGKNNQENDRERQRQLERSGYVGSRGR